LTYIKDLNDGIIRVMTVHKGPSTTNAFNLTFGNARTIAQLTAIVKDVVSTAILEERPRDKSKPIRGTLSTERAQSELNFLPQWPLEKGYRQ
jgi:nucleoside-diphosphate-sugar epimerase